MLRPRSCLTTASTGDHTAEVITSPSPALGPFPHLVCGMNMLPPKCPHSPLPPCQRSAVAPAIPASASTPLLFAPNRVEDHGSLYTSSLLVYSATLYTRPLVFITATEVPRRAGAHAEQRMYCVHPYLLEIFCYTMRSGGM